MATKKTEQPDKKIMKAAKEYHIRPRTALIIWFSVFGLIIAGPLLLIVFMINSMLDWK